MATITITTTAEEQQAVLDALRELQHETIPMSKIASKSGLSVSRVRYAIADLVEANRLRKIPTKAVNPRYIRYKYEII